MCVKTLEIYGVFNYRLNPLNDSDHAKRSKLK